MLRELQYGCTRFTQGGHGKLTSEEVNRIYNTQSGRMVIPGTGAVKGSFPKGSMFEKEGLEEG